MLNIKYNNQTILHLEDACTIEVLLSAIAKEVQHQDFYLLQNGKRIEESPTCNGVIHVVPKLVGGKGGFGSMLRAIGAQIEKTTNREACRDLSGRRLRDINEEKRLKAWIDKQTTREQEAEDKKQKKLERLVHVPKHEFKDATYDKERSELPERLEDAVTQGMEAAASSTSTATKATKRKSEVKKEEVKKKKMKAALWMDDLSCSDDSDGATSDDEDKSDKAEKTNKSDDEANDDDSTPQKIAASN